MWSSSESRCGSIEVLLHWIGTRQKATLLFSEMSAEQPHVSDSTVRGGRRAWFCAVLVMHGRWPESRRIYRLSITQPGYAVECFRSTHMATSPESLSYIHPSLQNACHRAAETGDCALLPRSTLTLEGKAMVHIMHRRGGSQLCVAADSWGVLVSNDAQSLPMAGCRYWRAISEDPSRLTGLWWDSTRRKLSSRGQKYTKSNTWLYPRKSAWEDWTRGAVMKRPPEAVSTSVQGQGVVNWSALQRASLVVGPCLRLCQNVRITDAVDALNLLAYEGCHVSLKSCGDLVLSRRIHALTVDSGYEEYAFSATHLEICSTTMDELIACKERHIGEAVETLSSLVQQGYRVSSSLFYQVLKRCTVQKNLVLGKQVHSLIIKSGYESDRFLANHIICMYGSHGLLEEASEVFYKVAAPDAHMWASIILTHARHGQPMWAIKLYRKMQELELKADNHIFVAVLKACASSADLASGIVVHADILSSGVEPDLFVGNCLVDMYAKCGSLEDARRVFDNLPIKDVVTWNAMISGYGDNGLVQKSLLLYVGMQGTGVQPNKVTFVCLLKACATAGALHQGKQLHAQIHKRGWKADVLVGNCLVDMYVKCGSLVDARQVFDNLQTRDVVTWNSMILGYVQYGFGADALSLHARMQVEGTGADEVTFVSLLKACASLRVLHRGKLFHAQIRKFGLEGNVAIGSCLVDMYAKCGSLQDARSVFAKLPYKNVATWNSILGGYVEHGFSQQALSLYGSMQQDGGIIADCVTFVFLLKACTSVGALHQGKLVHEQIQERRLEADLVIGSSLVDMYAKCGSLHEARKVIDNMPNSNVVTWTALLNGYAQHSDFPMARRCFEEMQQKGIEPDAATFICILVACSHEGLVNEGHRYFRMMIDDHGIRPSAYHYSCMVDLLARSGCLDEAENLVGSMPVKDDVVSWTSLLSACKSHGDVVRGKRCFDHMIALDPGNCTAYVLLAAIYSSAGMWRESQEIERLRKLAGAKKRPAIACIEVNNLVHEFTVGKRRADVLLKSMSMNSKLKDGGHVPHTELVLKAVSESKKEDALCGHAEKLALAFGLLKTPNGTPLLVTKNLRMCNDCHSATKIMSQIEQREITIRDAHRVHHFVDGSCSCGDRH